MAAPSLTAFGYLTRQHVNSVFSVTNNAERQATLALLEPGDLVFQTDTRLVYHFDGHTLSAIGTLN